MIEATVPEIQLTIDEGLITSESLVQQYLNRIAAHDDPATKASIGKSFTDYTV